MDIAKYHALSSLMPSIDRICCDAAGGEDQGGIGGFFGSVSNIAQGLIGTVQNFGDLLDVVRLLSSCRSQLPLASSH